MSEREKGRIDDFLELNLSKREMARRMHGSVNAISNYLKNTEGYVKNYLTSRPKRLKKKDLCRLKLTTSNSTDF